MTQPLTQETALKALQALANAKKARCAAEATYNRRGRKADHVYAQALRARDEEMAAAREKIDTINLDAHLAQRRAEEALEAADEGTKPTLQTPETAKQVVLSAHKTELEEANAIVESIRAEAEQLKTAFLEPCYTKLERARAREKKARDTIDALTEPVQKAH